MWNALKTNVQMEVAFTPHKGVTADAIAQEARTKRDVVSRPFNSHTLNSMSLNLHFHTLVHCIPFSNHKINSPYFHTNLKMFY